MPSKLNEVYPSANASKWESILTINALNSLRADIQLSIRVFGGITRGTMHSINELAYIFLISEPVEPGIQNNYRRELERNSLATRREIERHDSDIILTPIYLPLKDLTVDEIVDLTKNNWDKADEIDMNRVSYGAEKGYEMGREPLPLEYIKRFVDIVTEHEQKEYCTEDRDKAIENLIESLEAASITNRIIEVTERTIRESQVPAPTKSIPEPLTPEQELNKIHDRLKIELSKINMKEINSIRESLESIGQPTRMRNTAIEEDITVLLKHVETIGKLLTANLSSRDNKRQLKW